MDGGSQAGRRCPGAAQAYPMSPQQRGSRPPAPVPRIRPAHLSPRSRLLSAPCALPLPHHSLSGRGAPGCVPDRVPGSGGVGRSCVWSSGSQHQALGFQELEQEGIFSRCRGGVSSQGRLREAEPEGPGAPLLQPPTLPARAYGQGRRCWPWGATHLCSGRHTGTTAGLEPQKYVVSSPGGWSLRPTCGQGWSS